MGKILPIEAYGSLVLRKEGEDIDKNYPGLDNLIEDMFETMYQAKGVGLAAPQIGKAIIGNDVEIGSCSTIDRGALSNTVIGNGVKIDNLCQIAHNVTIGENSVFAGTASVAGSTAIGKNCMIGGGTLLNGHIEITDNVMFTGKSMVMRSVKEPGIYSSGVPVQPNKEWRKMAVHVPKIESLFKRVKELEKQLNKI